MSAKSHTDRGQLFGWDGANMWVEQTLDSDPYDIADTAIGRSLLGRRPCGCLPDEDCPYCHTVTVTK